MAKEKGKLIPESLKSVSEDQILSHLLTELMSYISDMRWFSQLTPEVQKTVALMCEDIALGLPVENGFSKSDLATIQGAIFGSALIAFCIGYMVASSDVKQFFHPQPPYDNSSTL